MALPASDRKVKRYCIHLYEEDANFIREMARGDAEVSQNKIIRECVASFVRNIKDLQRKNIDANASVLELDLEDILDLDEEITHER